MEVNFNGLFLTEESKEVLRQKATKTGYDCMVALLHVNLETNPKMTLPKNLLGEKIKIKIVGEGMNHTHHGFSVVLPEQIKPFYKGAKKVHMVYAHNKQNNLDDAHSLSFEQIEPFELEVIIGYVYYNKLRHYTDKLKPFFSSIEGYKKGTYLINLCEKLGISPKSYVILGNRNGFFAVMYGGKTKYMLIGENQVWYRQKSDLTIHKPLSNKETLPFYISTRRKGTEPVYIAEEYLKRYPETRMWYFAREEDTDLTVVQYLKDFIHYVHTVASFSCDTYYTKEEFLQLEGKVYAFEKLMALFEEDVQEINPFQRFVKLKDGQVLPYRLVNNYRAEIVRETY